MQNVINHTSLVKKIMRKIDHIFLDCQGDLLDKVKMATATSCPIQAIFYMYSSVMLFILFIIELYWRDELIKNPGKANSNLDINDDPWPKEPPINPDIM